jgi:hypothetical protein
VQQWDPRVSIVAQQWVSTMRPPVPLFEKRDRQTWTGPLWCSLTLEREEQLIITDFRWYVQVTFH